MDTAVDFNVMLELMDDAFTDFETAVPKPKLVNLPVGSVFRYQEKNVYQALVQKLARVQSALRAAYILLQKGFVQEQAMLQRAIDETNEDILFLVFAITNDRITELHKRYLDAFWEEEFDNADAMSSKQKRDVVPRKRIRAYLANIAGAPLDPSRGVELSRTISKAYSGFIHGASPHIMDLYGGNPPRYHTRGMLGAPRVAAHTEDLWSYMYRSLLSHIFVAKAFGAASHVDTLVKCKEALEKSAGREY
jgi:hypothetical protein